MSVAHTRTLRTRLCYVLCVSGLCSIIPFKVLPRPKTCNERNAVFQIEKRNKNHHDTNNCATACSDDAQRTVYNALHCMYLFHCSCFIHPYRFSLPFTFFSLLCSLSFVLIMITFICLLSMHSFNSCMHYNRVERASAFSGRRNAI